MNTISLLYGRTLLRRCYSCGEEDKKNSIYKPVSEVFLTFQCRSCGSRIRVTPGRIVKVAIWWLLANLILSSVVGLLIVNAPSVIKSYKDIIVPSYLVASFLVLYILVWTKPIWIVTEGPSVPVTNLELAGSSVMMVIAHIVGCFGIPLYLTGKWHSKSILGFIIFLPIIAAITVLSIRAFWFFAGKPSEGNSVSP